MGFHMQFEDLFSHIINDNKPKLSLLSIKNRMINIKTNALHADTQEEYNRLLSKGFTDILKSLRGE